jgi:hypothetical protein
MSKNYELSNPFQPNSSVFVIAGLEDFAFTIQSAELPPISLGAIATDYRGNQGFTTGDKITYSTATLNFIVDEQLVGYLSVFKWFHDAVKVTFEKDAVKDITIIINNAQNQPMAECKLVNCVPISLSGISLTTENADPVIATLDVEVDYIEYKTIA